MAGGKGDMRCLKKRHHKRAKMPTVRKTAQAVVVEWLDAATEDGWMMATKSAERKAPTCSTMGYIVGVTAREVTLMSTRSSSPDGTLDGNQHITIPTGCVVNVYRVKQIAPMRGWRKG